MRVAALAISSLVLLGCTPLMETRGYLPEHAVEGSIKIGADTKTTLLDRLGDPSTQATFSGDSWYYISSRQKRVAFFNPTVLSRTILAVHFDKDGKVTDVKHYGLQD